MTKRVKQPIPTAPAAQPKARRVSKIVLKAYDSSEQTYNYGPGTSGQVYVTPSGDLCINIVDLASNQYLSGEIINKADWTRTSFETTLD